MKRIVCLFLIFCMLLPLFVSCGEEKREGIVVTDMLGREVTVPKEVRRVVCIGAGALRLYSYVGDMSLLCGVESCERGFLISERPYQRVHEELFLSLPNIGAGGPGGSPDAEAVLASAPDLIFSLYTADSSAMDELEKKTGIPVVVLSYGETEAFDEDIFDSLTLMGQILGREERAAEVVDFIKGIRQDLAARTAGLEAEEKPRVYIGCHSKYGTHGIGSSVAGYSLFEAVGARNVLDEAGYKGYQNNIDLESLSVLDPEVILLDAGGLSVFLEEYGEKREVIETLGAFQSGEVYVQMPYNAYYTNLEIAYTNAYFIGKMLYPERFSDIDLEIKGNEIFEALLGESCFDELLSGMPYVYEKLNMEKVVK